MIEVVNFTVSYAPVAGIIYLWILISISSEEGLIFLSWSSPIPFRIRFYPTLHKYPI